MAADQDTGGHRTVADGLIRVCDLAGRPRGTGFLADADGTMITSHEAVDGLARLVLHAPGDQVCLVEAAAVTTLPETGLALVATEGLGLPPLPIAPSGPAHPDRRTVVRMPHPVGGSVVGTTAVTYTATDRFHLLDEVYEIALDGLDPHAVPPQISGAPLLDARTGAVLGVVATALALHAGRRAGGFALPLRARGAPAPLAALLARNAATVPSYGPHLNLAGTLQLTGTTIGSAAGPGPWHEPVERPEVSAALEEFMTASGEPAPGGRPPLVLGLVGEPGTGRSTELARLAARRAQGLRPAPTLWLRGADLRPGDGGIKDAVERALRTAARIVGAAGTAGATGGAAAGAGAGGLGPVAGPGFGIGSAASGEPPYASPDAVADLAGAVGRPLLVLLDAPEEMPPVLAHALADWTAGTASWLRAGRARLVVACRPEFWEQAGALFEPEILHDPETAVSVSASASVPARGSGSGSGSAAGERDAGEGRSAKPAPRVPVRDLPPCLRLGDLTAAQAEEARARFGLPPGAVAAADAAHPLVLRLLSEVRAALPVEDAVPVEDEAPRTAGGTTGTRRPDDAEQDRAGAVVAPGRVQIYSAHLDLVCLRIAVRLAGSVEPRVRGRDVRRLAARVAGQVHEAARRSLGPGQGELDREAFEELFPWRTGWASAVLTEGLLVPAGAGYRFAHEGVADWLQALHLDLDAALHALVHRWFAPADAPAATPAEAPVRLPSRPAARAAAPPCVPPAPAVAPTHFPRSLPVPRHRAGAVVEALLLTSPGTLAAHLGALVRVLDGHAPPPTRVTPRPPAPSSVLPPADLDADTVPNPRIHRAARPARAAGTAGVVSPAAGLPGWLGHLPGAEPSAAGAGAAAPPGAAGVVPPRPVRAWPARAVRQADAVWWAAHLLREVLLRVPDAAPHRAVLRELAARVVVRAVEAGGFNAAGLGGLGEFGPWFWRRVPLPPAERLELLRVLLPADPPPVHPPRSASTARAVTPSRPSDRFLDAAGELLRAHPAQSLPVVCGWFADDRPLRTAGPAPGQVTVATAAQALLYAHRRLAVDDLTEALATAAHPGADEVLGVLAEEEPSAVCRAVDRWAHDPRPDRHVAAAAYGARTAPHVRSQADRELLRHAALTLLARPDDCTLHGAALGLLVRDPDTRAHHLPAALRHFASGAAPGDSCGGLHPGALISALGTDPEAVLAAFAARLRHADARTAEAVLAELAGPAQAEPARRIAAVVEEHLRRRPEHAAAVARHLDLRLEQGPGARPALLPLAAALLRDHPAQVRRVLVPVFAAPGTRQSRPLRQELLDSVLATERDPVVLDALLTAAADGARQRHPLLTRDLVHRLGLLMGRTPEGTARFDRRIVELAAAVPTFAAQVRAWLADGGSWDALIGPSARRRLDTVA
jgi:hypothetical protein